jgi:hypothetical protein
VSERTPEEKHFGRLRERMTHHFGAHAHVNAVGDGIAQGQAREDAARAGGGGERALRKEREKHRRQERPPRHCWRRRVQTQR